MKNVYLLILYILFSTFEAFSQSSLSGTVYNDLNNNAVFNAGEELQNVKVWLFNYSSVAPYYRVQPIAEVFTNASGNYSFPGLATGNYQVRVCASTLPPSLCRSVKDIDSYPNGVTDMNGIDGTSAYSNIDFGFATNMLTPGFISARSFKWNLSNTFTGGQLSNTYSLTPETISGTTYYPTITWTTDRTCAPGGGYGADQFPSAVTGTTLPYNFPGANKGGIDPADNTFQLISGSICYNSSDSDKQITTIGFNYPVTNVKFSIYDIDHADPQVSSGRIDHVKVSGYYNATPVTPVIVNPSSVPWNTISGNNICGFTDYPLAGYTLAYNSGNEDHGTVNVYFQNSITSIVIEYTEWATIILSGKGINDATPPVSATNEGSWSVRSPTSRGIGIGGIDYTFDGITILPVTITSFTVKEKECNHELNWSIENADNFKEFEIESSKDGNTFISTGTVAYQLNKANYSFIDKDHQNENIFYRLKWTDVNGKSKYSTTLKGLSDCLPGKSVKIIPNPVHNKDAEISLKGYPKGKYTLDVFTTSGKKVLSGTVIITESGNANLQIATANLKGIYFLNIKDNYGKLIKTEKLVAE